MGEGVESNASVVVAGVTILERIHIPLAHLEICAQMNERYGQDYALQRERGSVYGKRSVTQKARAATLEPFSPVPRLVPRPFQ